MREFVLIARRNGGRIVVESPRLDYVGAVLLGEELRRLRPEARLRIVEAGQAGQASGLVQELPEWPRFAPPN